MALDHRGLGRAVSWVPDGSGPQGIGEGCFLGARWLCRDHRGLGSPTDDGGGSVTYCLLCLNC